MAKLLIILAIAVVLAAGGSLLLWKALQEPVNYDGGFRLVFKIALPETPVSPADQERLIGILKQRVGPTGRRKLQWRTVGADCIEVRMPASSPQVAAARDAYEAALTAAKEAGVDVQQLERLLATCCLSPQAAEEMTPSKQLRLADRLTQRLAQVRRRYDEPTNALVGDMVDRYEAWANLCQPWDDPQHLIRLAGHTGTLEFRVAPAHDSGNVGIGAVDDPEKYYRQIEEEGPEPGRERGDRFAWFPVRDQEAFRHGRFLVWPRDPQAKGERYILLCNEPAHAMLHGDWNLSSARRMSAGGRPVAQFTFDDREAKQFGELTGAHIGDYMAILIDEEAYSAPNIRSQIHKTGIIEGQFTLREVDEMVAILEKGSFPQLWELESMVRIREADDAPQR